MALALFADDDYREAAARLTGTLALWGCWDGVGGSPTSGGITQARQRLGFEPLRELFSQVAVPVADELTRGAFLGRWRLMSIDGFEWDAPDTKENAAAFGYSGAGPDELGRAAFPKARVVHGQRVRLARGRGRGDRQGRGEGRRGAVPGPRRCTGGWKRTGC